MSKKIITIEFDNAKDAEEVLHAIWTKIEITWMGGTKKAMIATDKKKGTVLVSKSISVIPNPIRL